MAFTSILKNIANPRETLIIQMDADLSHNPLAIPNFLAAAKEADLAVGSRYMPGGGILHWNFFRRLVSRGGNIYAAAILGVPYTDLTSGYKCYRADVLSQIDLEGLSSVGYNFQIETAYLAHKKGFKIAEIPIIFTERKMGGSKFSWGIILEAFWKVMRLRFKK